MIEVVVLSFAVTVYVATAAYTDVRMHRIPNWVTMPAALLGLIYHGVTSGGSGILMSLAGFAIGGALLFLPWLLGGGGMGDVKLLAALGGWLGPKWLLIAFVLSMLTASAMALTVLFYGAATEGVSKAKKKFTRGLRTAAHTTKGNRPSRRVVPFAVPVAVGTCAVLVWLVRKGTL